MKLKLLRKQLLVAASICLLSDNSLQLAAAEQINITITGRQRYAAVASAVQEIRNRSDRGDAIATAVLDEYPSGNPTQNEAVVNAYNRMIEESAAARASSSSGSAAAAGHRHEAEGRAAAGGGGASSSSSAPSGPRESQQAEAARLAREEAARRRGGDAASSSSSAAAAGPRQSPAFFAASDIEVNEFSNIIRENPEGRFANRQVHIQFLIAQLQQRLNTTPQRAYDIVNEMFGGIEAYVARPQETEAERPRAQEEARAREAEAARQAEEERRRAQEEARAREAEKQFRVDMEERLRQQAETTRRARAAANRTPEEQAEEEARHRNEETDRQARREADRRQAAAGGGASSSSGADQAAQAEHLRQLDISLRVFRNSLSEDLGDLMRAGAPNENAPDARLRRDQEVMQRANRAGFRQLLRGVVALFSHLKRDDGTINLNAARSEIRKTSILYHPDKPNSDPAMLQVLAQLLELLEIMIRANYQLR